MFTSPLNRFIQSDEDMQDDNAPTGESPRNKRPTRMGKKKASVVPQPRDERYSAESHNGPDGKPTEPIHYDGESAPSSHGPGRYDPSVGSGQKTAHENMRTNSGRGQNGGNFADGGAEDYEDYREPMSLGRSASTRVVKGSKSTPSKSTRGTRGA